MTITIPIGDAELEYTPTEGKAAVIICPGGGYNHLSHREGGPVARRFNEEGFFAAVLRYSVIPEELKLKPLKQLAWAVRYVKSLGFDRVFVMGFSAGAHLAGSFGAHWNDAELFTEDELAAQRTLGQILCYPVVSAGRYGHKESMTNLTGGDEGLAEYFSLENQITTSTPPTFMWHSGSDMLVPVENSLMLYAALRAAGVEAELHIFPYGEHGLSLATPEVEQVEKNRFADAHLAEWFTLCLSWMGHILKD